MKKPISPRVHGVIDYATAAATALMPLLSRRSRSATRTAETWAAGYAILSALTNYPLAIKRAIPFKSHGTIDRALGLVVPAMPWIIGFARDRRARNFFLGLAAVSVVVTVLTDWDSNPAENTGW